MLARAFSTLPIHSVCLVRQIICALSDALGVIPHAMAWVPIVEGAVWLGSMLTCGVLLWRLGKTGLWRNYPAFSLFVVVEVSRDILLWTLAPHRNAYGQAFVITGPLRWSCDAIVLRELYLLVLRNYPGMARVSRTILLAFLMLVLALAVLIMFTASTGETTEFPILHYYRAAELAVTIGMTVLLAVILSLFVWFPIEVSQNINAYFTGYAFYFYAKAAALLIVTRHSGMVDEIASLVINLVFFLTTCYWALRVNRTGAQMVRVSSFRRTPEEEMQLRKQLARINDLLSGLRP
jgi:hypothetical protein